MGYSFEPVMKGSIHSDQRCPICGEKFTSFEPRGMWCARHPDQHPTRYVVRFGKITRRMKSYEAAYQLLTGLRYESAKGSLDLRDFQVRNKPLAVGNLAKHWLEVKQSQVSRSHWNNLKNYLGRAVVAWGQETNIKSIGYAEIESCLLAQTDLTDKTRANMRSGLHDFWAWVARSQKIPMPEFPTVRFSLGTRAITDKKTQLAILDEIQRLTWDMNPKLWFYVKMCSTYINLRPMDILRIKEGEINLESGKLLVPTTTKTGRPQLFSLLEEDLEFIRWIRGDVDPLPHLPFFRHTKGTNNVKEGTPFARTFPYRWWKKACANLGIEGLDLYGGTRHTSTTALLEHFAPSEIKAATGHNTNAAFERYLQQDDRHLQKVFAQSAGSQKAGEVVELRRKVDDEN